MLSGYDERRELHAHLMNFSLFFNTRGRPKLLENLLYSIFKYTKDLSNIEILINCDNDDVETINYLSHYYSDHKIIKWFKINRPDNLHIVLNSLAKKANGQYLFVLNDDIEFLIQNWDEIVLNKIKGFKEQNKILDDILYCYIDDNSVDRNRKAGYCSFPIISKEAVDILGFFMYENFVGLGGDTSIHKLYKLANRLVDCSEIKLDHVTHNNLFKVMSPDKTAAKMRENTQKSFVDPYLFDVSKEVGIISNYLRYG